MVVAAMAGQKRAGTCCIRISRPSFRSKPKDEETGRRGESFNQHAAARNLYLQEFAPKRPRLKAHRVHEGAPMLSLIACSSILLIFGAGWAAKLSIIWAPAVFLLALMVPLTQMEKFGVHGSARGTRSDPAK